MFPRTSHWQFLYGKLFLFSKLLTSPLQVPSFTPRWLSLLGSCCLAHLGFLVTGPPPTSVPPGTPGDTGQTPWVVSLKFFSVGWKRQESLSPLLHGGDWNPQHTNNSLQKTFSNLLFLSQSWMTINSVLSPPAWVIQQQLYSLSWSLIFLGHTAYGIFVPQPGI